MKCSELLKLEMKRNLKSLHGLLTHKNMWIPLLEQAQMSEKVANEDVSKFFFILDGQAGILASKTLLLLFLQP
jgi:hypothetical protein